MLVTCFVVALNSQFARPAPRHSSSTRSGCAVNDLLFKMATRSSGDKQRRTREGARLRGVGRPLEARAGNNF